MMHGETRRDQAIDRDTPDDLLRDVYCILGIPVDAIGMQSCLNRIEAAATSRMPFLISTPNLNFLVISQSDPDFRGSLLLSDLCPADGMPIVWIAWLLGIPIKGRVAGSDIFDALKTGHDAANPLKVFLFGGAEGVAAAACRALNAATSGLDCVGSLDPGFGSIDELSRDDIIDSINSSDANFLVASLGAKKGQMWLQRNHHRLIVPIRAHLGAAINFEAGTVGRSPSIMRRLGLEWLWRIKEEPYLWRRYWNDGRVLLALLLTQVIPLAIWAWWLQLRYQPHNEEFVVKQIHDHNTVILSLSGSATAPHIDKIIPVFRDAIAIEKQLVIDFTNTRAIDARFQGLLLMLAKKLKTSGTSAVFTGLSPGLKRMFRLNGLGGEIRSVP